MRELSDDEVFGGAAKELSDDEVFGTPAPKASSRPRWMDAAEQLMADTAAPAVTPGRESVMQDFAPAVPFDFKRASMARRAIADMPAARPQAEVRETPLAARVGMDIGRAVKNPAAKGMIAGLSGLGQVIPGVVEAGADLVGADKVADFAAGAANQGRMLSDPLRPTAGNDKLVFDVFNSITQSSPTLMVGVAGGPAMKALFAQSAAQEYSQGKAAGLDGGSAAARAGVMAGAEVLGERFGFSEQIKILKGLTKGLPADELAPLFARQMLKEIPGEQLTTLVQFLGDKYGPGALNPEAALADYLNQAGETLKVTVGQTALMGGGPALIQGARDPFGNRPRPEQPANPVDVISRVMGQPVAPTPAPAPTPTPTPTPAPAPTQDMSAVADRIVAAIEGSQPQELSDADVFGQSAPDVSQIAPTIDTSEQRVEKAPEIEQVGPSPELFEVQQKLEVRKKLKAQRENESAQLESINAKTPNDWDKVSLDAVRNAINDDVQAIADLEKEETRLSAQPGDAPGEGAGSSQPTQVAPILQNRNRATPASIAQMQSIATDPDYGRLGFSRDFANGAPVVAGGQINPAQLGRTDVAVASDGRRIPVQYAVMEAADVLPSNAADGTPITEYATATNRTRAIAGNGRIAGLQSAYGKGTTGKYLDELANDTLHGIAPEVIRSMRSPVLVRVMPEGQITNDIGDVSNTQGNLSLSPTEQANNDANRVNLDALQFAEDGGITAEAVRQFVRAMPKAEQGGLLDTNGQPTKQAVDRVNAAVFAKAYGNDQLVRLYAQAQDPEARLILSALARVAPKMARLDGAGALDIRGVVTQAAELAVNARRQGVSLQRAAQQVDMTTDPDVAVVLNLFASNARSNKAVVDALSRAADFAYNEANKPAADMFGEVPRASRGQVIDQLGQQDEQPSQATLENAAGGQPVGQDAGRQADGPTGPATPPEAQAGGTGQAEGLTANEPGKAYNETNEPDLFGDPVPAQSQLFGGGVPAQNRERQSAERPATTEAGDVQPASAVPDDTPAPAAEYFVRTVVGKVTDKQLGSNRILTASEAAQATAYLYRSAVERFDAVVTDKDGKPLAIVGNFKGAISQTSVYPATVMGEAVRVPGAAKIWFSHNHPSGTAELSTADKRLNKTLTEVFRGSGIEPMGLLAIAGDRFAYVAANGSASDNNAMQPPIKGTTVPVMEREQLSKDEQRPRVSSIADAKVLAEKFYKSSNSPGLLLIDTQNAVVAWMPLPENMRGQLRDTGAMNAIYRAVSESNAAAALIVHGGELDVGLSARVSSSQNIGAALEAIDVRPLDSINVVTRKSAAESGLTIAAGPVYDLPRRQEGNPFDRLPEKAKANMASRLDSLADRLESGQITDEQYAEGAQNVLEQVASITQRKVNRGPDWIQERLIRAKRKGELEADTVDFALWALSKNPAMANDLAVLVSDTKEAAAGDYNPATETMRLFKSTASETTAVHEILHHTERMMPPEVQAGILREYNRAWGETYKKADNRVKALMRDMLVAAAGDRKSMDRVVNAFADGTLDYDLHYSLFNPSEFWAVKASDILAKRYEVKGSWVGQAKQWLRELIQFMKAKLGMPSDAPILKALEAVLKGDGTKFSPDILADVETVNDMGRAETLRDIPKGPPKASGNRDALGRVKFKLGEVALGKLDAATRPLQERFGMRMASPELRKQLRKMKATIDQANQSATNVAQQMKDMSEADRAMVSDIVEKMIAPGVVPPEHAIRVADAITKTMDRQTDELVGLGMLSQESADRWRGRYLPRIYNRKTELDIDSPMDAVKNMFKTGRPTGQGIGGGSLKGRGLFEDVSVDSVDQWIAMGYEVRDPHWKLNQGKLELVDKNAPKVAQEKVTVWRDWTPQERAEMGENRDALFRYVQGYTSMQRDIALGRLFNQIANNPEWVRRSGAEGWVQVPDTEIPDTGGVKRYGNLAGLWVRRDVMSHLTRFEEAANESLQIWREALGIWKEGKTALNPVAHFNNIASNISMAHFAGVSYWDGHKYVGAARDLVNDAPMVEEARNAGLFTGSYTKEELVNNMPPELQKMMQMEEGKLRKSGRQVMNALTFWLRTPLRNAYEFEDTYFKYLIYRDARNQGMSPEDATDYALRYIFTYDDLPSGARKVRDFAIPFFSWTYKAMPALLHTAAVYPWRFLAPAAMLNGINLIAYALAAGDEDDNWLEKIAKGQELEKEEREVLPDRMQGKGMLYNPKSVRLGTDEVTGNPIFLDVSRVVPGGDMFDMENQAGGLPIPAPLMPNHPVLSAFAAMIANKEMFMGREVVDRNDTGIEAAEKRAKWMAGFLLPAVAPGGYHSQRILDATANAMDTVISTPLGDFTGVDRSGLPVQPKFAAMQTLGIKARPMDLTLEEQRRKGQESALINSITAEVRSMARLHQRGAVSDEMMDRTREKAREKIERMREE